MPQLLVVTDLPEAGGKVVYRERIASSDFESTHFTDQLAERVGWAVRDADELTHREEIGPSKRRSARRERDAAAPGEEPVPPGVPVLAS